MRGSWRLNKDCNILTPTLIAISVVSFSFSRCSTGGPGAHLSAECWLSLPHLITNGSPKLHRGPESPFGRVWLSLPHLVSNSSYLQLTDFLSPPSYIIVQSPTQSPTQSLEWHVWSSSSGNNCHAVQRSLSSGASVYECIMGFYLVPFHQLYLPTRFLSITGHWNVSLPSGESPWNGMFGDFFRLLAIGMCHFLPVNDLGMACLAGSKVNIQQT